MMRSKRLEPIGKLAKNNEKLAAQELGRKKEVHSLEEQKLQQLVEYRNEYVQEMQNKVKLGVNAASLQRYHQFLNKLDLAITQQQEVIKKCVTQLNVTQGEWQNNRSRSKAIADFTSRVVKQEQKVSDKKEANRADEMSTQAFLRNHAK